ncbi:hypothetical protein VNI00_012079 [Paramarasmius palmivorus]|uniref:Uncharacterized protein n=1 Tax=Paramarasmius palmivorus TaxID=297713 RepID=A0AAW0CAQ8_9AGAR
MSSLHTTPSIPSVNFEHKTIFDNVRANSNPPFRSSNSQQASFWNPRRVFLVPRRQRCWSPGSLPSSDYDSDGDDSSSLDNSSTDSTPIAQVKDCSMSRKALGESSRKRRRPRYDGTSGDVSNGDEEDTGAVIQSLRSRRRAQKRGRFSQHHIHHRKETQHRHYLPDLQSTPIARTSTRGCNIQSSDAPPSLGSKISIVSAHNTIEHRAIHTADVGTIGEGVWDCPMLAREPLNRPENIGEGRSRQAEISKAYYERHKHEIQAKAKLHKAKQKELLDSVPEDVKHAQIELKRQKQREYSHKHREKNRAVINARERERRRKLK